MTRIVSPEQFVEAFLEVVEMRKAEIHRAWWLPGGRYTDLMLGGGASILAKVAKGLGLLYCREYFGIDGVMCEQTDRDHFGPDWWAAEQLAVVVEHENVIGGLRDGAQREMNRLTIYNCPLKVLITYPFPGTRHDRLSDYADIARRADVFRDFSTKRKHVVIFGLWEGTRRTGRVDWEAHLYRRRSFSELKPHA